MTGYPAQNDCFATVSKMSVIIYNILHNIYFELKTTIASRLDMESEKNDKILLFTTANGSQCK